jgi:hypothetical protein
MATRREKRTENEQTTFGNPLKSCPYSTRTFHGDRRCFEEGRDLPYLLNLHKSATSILYATRLFLSCLLSTKSSEPPYSHISMQKMLEHRQQKLRTTDFPTAIFHEENAVSPSPRRDAPQLLQPRQGRLAIGRHPSVEAHVDQVDRRTHCHVLVRQRS